MRVSARSSSSDASQAQPAASTAAALPVQLAGSRMALNGVHKVAREWLAAGVGCALADTIFNPLEFLKVRRQLEGAHGATVARIASTAFAAEGLYGLWQPGLLATWLRGLSYTGFRIGLYPSVRDACQSALGGEESLISRIAAGAVTGAIGSLAFNPVDVVRVRMQSASPPPSTFGAFGLVAAERAAYRGWHASAARASALSGSQLATYDTAKRVFKRHGWLTDEHGMETAALHSAASLLSGFVAQTVAQPFDTAKAILMADSSSRPAAKVLRDAIISRGGLPRAAFVGYLPALARQGPVMLVQMPIVEGLRKLCGLDYF